MPHTYRTCSRGTLPCERSPWLPEQPGAVRGEQSPTQGARLCHCHFLPVPRWGSHLAPKTSVSPSQGQGWCKITPDVVILSITWGNSWTLWEHVKRLSWMRVLSSSSMALAVLLRGPKQGVKRRWDFSKPGFANPSSKCAYYAQAQGTRSFIPVAVAAVTHVMY